MRENEELKSLVGKMRDDTLFGEDDVVEKVKQCPAADLGRVHASEGYHTLSRISGSGTI